MIKFKKTKNKLILEYFGDDEPRWVYDKFKNNEGIYLYKTFFLTKSNLIKKFKSLEDLDCQFKFGVLDKEYYKIDKNILDIRNILYIHKDLKLEKKTFVTYYQISIFRHIDKLINEPIFLGGQNRNAISYSDFEKILTQFPNTTERVKYYQARLSIILGSYFESMLDAKSKYEKYMNKKKSFHGESLSKIFKNYEKKKYEIILDKLTNMISKENQYNERQWQEEIIEILCLIFPKYIKAFKKVKIKDSYSENKKRELDYLLIDSDGYIDIVEIKRPLGSPIVSEKPTYRGNYYPIRELSGTVMQVEKYILHLNKWGKRGEEYLNKKYVDYLPSDCKIKITNPGAIIILGRSNKLNIQQKNDFEIIKRKYKNIIDVITYDDLIKRLEFIIRRLS